MSVIYAVSCVHLKQYDAMHVLIVLVLAALVQGDVAPRTCTFYLSLLRSHCNKCGGSQIIPLESLLTTDELEALGVTCTSCEGDIVACNAQQSVLETTLSDCQSRIDECSASIVTETELLTTCMEHGLLCNATLAVCESDVDAVRPDADACTAQIQALQVELDECDTSVAQCGTDTDDCASDVESTETQLETCLDMLNTTQAANATCASEVTALPAAIADCESDTVACQANYASRNATYQMVAGMFACAQACDARCWYSYDAERCYECLYDCGIYRP